MRVYKIDGRATDWWRQFTGLVCVGSNQVPVHETLSNHSDDHGTHLINRVVFPEVVLSGELDNVPLKVFRADLVIDAIVCTFQGSPKRTQSRWCVLYSGRIPQHCD